MSGRRRVYIGKLAADTRPRDLEYEVERYGRVRDFHMRSGYAFVTFESSRDADECVRDLDGRRFDGARLIVEFAKDKDTPGGPSDRARPTKQNRVIIEGLSGRTSWQDLKDEVKRVTNCDVAFCDVTDGGTKGWAEFRTAEDMAKAIKDLDGAKLRDNTVRAYAEGGAPPAAAPRSPSPARAKRSRSRSGSRSRSPSPSKKNKEESNN